MSFLPSSKFRASSSGPQLETAPKTAPDQGPARLRISRDNYSHMDGINDTQVDVGHFFGGKWANNIFANNLDGALFSDNVKRDLLPWRTTTGGSEPRRQLISLRSAMMLVLRSGVMFVYRYAADLGQVFDDGPPRFTCSAATICLRRGSRHATHADSERSRYLPGNVRRLSESLCPAVILSVLSRGFSSSGRDCSARDPGVRQRA
jgi:hypothetical protein